MLRNLTGPSRHAPFRAWQSEPIRLKLLRQGRPVAQIRNLMPARRHPKQRPRQVRWTQGSLQTRGRGTRPDPQIRVSERSARHRAARHRLHARNRPGELFPILGLTIVRNFSSNRRCRRRRRDNGLRRWRRRCPRQRSRATSHQCCEEQRGQGLPMRLRSRAHLRLTFIVLANCSASTLCHEHGSLLDVTHSGPLHTSTSNVASRGAKLVPKL